MLKLERLASCRTSAARKPAWFPPSTGPIAFYQLSQGSALTAQVGFFLACPSHGAERSQSCVGSCWSPACCCKTCVRWPALQTQPRRRAGAARGRGMGREHQEAAPAVLDSTFSSARRLVTQPAGKTHRSQVMHYIKHIVSVSSHLVNALR